jgi:large subunit ribosomal protein L13
MYKMTDSQKPAAVSKDWIVVDATDVALGRLSSAIAKRLRGKHKADFTPHVDNGDNIIVVNAAKVRLTGMKLYNRVFNWHTGYPGGLKGETAKETLEKHPERLVERAVKRMLPRTKLGRAQLKKLHVYAAAEHPHTAQKPQEIKL